MSPRMGVSEGVSDRVSPNTFGPGAPECPTGCVSLFAGEETPGGTPRHTQTPMAGQRDRESRHLVDGQPAGSSGHE